MNAAPKEAVELIKMQAYGYTPAQIADTINADAVIAYHITPRANVDNIRMMGLRATSCQQSYTRPPAVYLFLDRDDCAPNAPIILGNNVPYAIITITLPRDLALQLQDDSLYRGSFDTAYSCAKLPCDIPASMITDISLA